MQCKIEGCESVAMYPGKMLCQKHYFRFMRYGTYDLVGPRKAGGIPTVRAMRKSNAAGYQLIFYPTHPLAMKDGYVYEHRMVVYAVHGESLPACEVCGKNTFWKTCHIDHRDNNIVNNSADNLRPLCRACNTFRDYPKQYEKKNCRAITFEGVTQTPEEWSRDARVSVVGRTITLRKMAGMSDFDALFSPKLTHNKKSQTKKAKGAR